MENFHNLARHVLNIGEYRPNRTDDPTVAGVFGGELSYNLQHGLPLLSTKFTNFDAVIAELLAFLNAATSAADFRKFGTKIWDKNANSGAWLDNPHRAGHDHLGPIYGYQWRSMESVKLLKTTEPDELKRRRAAYVADGYEVLGSFTVDGGGMVVLRKFIDQWQDLIDGIRNDPYGRRHKVTAWNPACLKEVALPACHDGFQCYVRAGKYIDVKMTQRSADLFLGVPFNIASYAALTHIIARLTGYLPGRLTLSFGDLHIYESHMDGVREMLKRDHFEMPTLELMSFEKVEDLTRAHFKLSHYEAHPAIKVAMAN